ncbi:MAG TPA: YciI family protein [Longimicrobium sp.]|nr:YciI family protein [Longimicrobium sp.]
MRFMIIRKADPDTEAGVMPTQALVDAMMRYNQELIDAGVMRGGEGLQPSVKGARIRFSGGTPAVVDGPFAEAKELIAGYTIIDVAGREEAIAWARRWPVEDGGGEVELEIRQAYTADDFGEFAPDLREMEERMRAAGQP